MTVGWLAGMPPHWQALPLRYIAEPLGGLTFGPEDISEAENGTLVLRSSNIQNGAIDLTDALYVNVPVPSRMLLQPGDILVCSRNGSRALIGKNASIPPELEGQTFGAFMTVLRSSANEFLYWVLNSPLFEQQSATFLTSTINQLTLGNFKSFIVPYPPEDERRRISIFLARETAQIDALIGKQARLIELLAERRQAFIAHAVTKGLDPNAPTKPSGIPWLGDINASWPVRPLKAAGQIRLGKMIQPSPKTETDFEAPYLRAANVQPNGVLALDDVKKMWFNESELRSLDVRSGDVVVVEGGIGGFGRAAYVEKDLPGFGYQNSINRIRPSESEDGRYLTYLLLTARHAGFIHAYCTGVSMPHLTAEKLAAINVPLPARSTQTEISDRLDAQISKLNALSDKASAVIANLSERRSALISAALTGKLAMFS